MAGWLEMDPLCWWCGAAAQETETETGFDGQIAHIIKATLQAIQRVFGLPRRHWDNSNLTGHYRSIE